jgi:hypothetical protein
MCDQEPIGCQRACRDRVRQRGTAISGAPVATCRRRIVTPRRINNLAVGIGVAIDCYRFLRVSGLGRNSVARVATSGNASVHRPGIVSGIGRPQGWAEIVSRSAGPERALPTQRRLSWSHDHIQASRPGAPQMRPPYRLRNSASVRGPRSGRARSAPKRAFSW